MIKQNILMCLLIVVCGNTLYGGFPKWFTLDNVGNITNMTSQLGGLLLQVSPSAKKAFGLSDLEAVNLVNQKIQMHFHLTQLITNLRSLMTNEYYKQLSVIDQFIAYQLSLSAAQISRNTLTIR